MLFVCSFERAKKIKIFLIFVAILFSFNSFSQLVLNNGVIVNMNGGAGMATAATMVLNNPPATPITRLGTTTTQGIKLETEWSRIQYNLSTGTTAITIPYISNTTGTWVPFPLTVRNITAGTNSGIQPGAIRFSSTKTSGAIATGWDNNTYKPSQVLNVCNPMVGACPASNNSADIVDRFWVMEPVYYSVRPAVTLDITYLMMETDINSGNTAGLAGLLQPQRFDTTSPNSTTAPIWGWNGFPSTPAEQGTNTPAGSITATSTGTVTGIQVSSANFFPDWTLASYLMPLPVELVEYKGNCSNNRVYLQWVTSNEINNQYFTIEKSADNINFSPLAIIPAAISGNQTNSYNYFDVSPGENPVMYYRLKQTDKNGATEILKTIVVNGCNTSDTENSVIYSYQNQVFINMFSLSDQDIHVTGYDVTGRLIFENSIFVSSGYNHINLAGQLAQGVYLFKLESNKITVVDRILIQN